MGTVWITSKGRITIPIGIRKRARFLPNTQALFERNCTAVRIFPDPAPAQESRGGLMLARLKGSATVKLTTDQILAATRRPWPP